MPAGRALLAPLLVIGIGSIVWWLMRDDLRLYGVVQFFPVLAIPGMLLARSGRYTGVRWVGGMCALYGVAKILEAADARLGGWFATGGHPWKHLAAAGALLSYCIWVHQRRPVR